MTAIELNGLTKRFGARAAVDNLTARVPAGRVTGFIGPNGAGKTTTMAMLLGLVTPTSGTGHVLGAPLDDPAAYLGRVGALVETPAFWPGLTGRENLRALADLAAHDVRRVDLCLELVGLRDRGDDRYGTYSLGMKQRLGIAAALLGDPELLVLDEPVNGLDPTGITEMRHLIGELAREGRTVLVSSHLLSELEQIADWLLVIDRGAAVYEGPASEFASGAAATVQLVPERVVDVDKLLKVLAGEGHAPRRDGELVVVGVDGDEPRTLSASLNRAAADAGIVLSEVRVNRPNLEAYYLTMVEGGDR
jgi:ABC-2 type transport system ATP-binding protein